GIHHKSAVITLVERLSKAIIVLKPEGRKAVGFNRDNDFR
ncbi:IS30 family transposase, partial [Enterococcus faecium]